MNQAIQFPDREEWDENKRCKQIRPLSDEEKAGLRYSANNYVKWKDEYLDQGNQTQP